jgi:BRCT domain type II-containing protein
MQHPAMPKQPKPSTYKVKSHHERTTFKRARSAKQIIDALRRTPGVVGAFASNGTDSDEFPK